MRKHSLLKTMLLLCALIVGSSSAWAQTDYDFVFSNTTGSYNSTNKTITWTDSYCTILQEKGSTTATDPNSSYVTSPRWYKGNAVTFTPASGYTINKIVMVGSSSSYNGQTMTATTGTVANTSNTTTTWEGTATNANPLILTMGSQLRVSTVTITYAAADSRPVVATGIDLPTAQKTLVVGDLDQFEATATKADGFTGTITYSYTTKDDDIIGLLEDGTFEAVGRGKATITITATPTGGNAENYRTASQDVEVTVKGKTTLEINNYNYTVAYADGNKPTFTATVADGYDGTLQVESSNTSVATVEIDGTTITVTAKAVGSANITVTAPQTNDFVGSVSKEIEVKFTQPEGGTTAKPAGEITLFHETFGNNSGSARDWSNSYSVKSGIESVYSDITSYTVSNAKQGKNTTGATDSGLNQSSSESEAMIIIGPLKVTDYSNMTLSYQWKAGSVKGTYYTKAYYATSATGDYTELEGTGTGATTFVKCDYSLPEAAQVSTLYLKIVWSTSNTQGIIDEVDLSCPSTATVTATLNNEGYATFCSEYPVDFSDAEGFSAWQITGINGNAIKFEKVIGPVKGGTGLLLKGDANAPISIKSVDSDIELTANLLEGTLAYTYVEANEYYGLSGKNFVPVNAAGTVKPGKALLPASLIPDNARQLTFVFDEEGNTTSIDVISKTEDVRSEVYNLNGQRVAQPTKGLYIVNGKKVVVK